MQIQQPPRIRKQGFTSLAQLKISSIPDKKRLTNRFLQTFYLHTDRRL